MEVLWLIKDIKSGLWSFVLKIFSLDNAPQSSRQAEVDSDHWDINWEKFMFYQMGDRQHNQKSQISKVIGENEKRVFYFSEKY